MVICRTVLQQESRQSQRRRGKNEGRWRIDRKYKQGGDKDYLKRRCEGHKDKREGA